MIGDYNKTVYTENTDVTPEVLNNNEDKTAELDSWAAAHSADFTLQVPYGGTTTNTGNDYVISSPAISALSVGMAISVKINVDSTGTSTLNWDSKGAKAIKKVNGSDIINLKNGGIYTLRYDGTNFILQGEGASGNALASNLALGKTATTDAGEITGTLIDRYKVVTTLTGSYITLGAVDSNGNTYYHKDSGGITPYAYKYDYNGTLIASRYIGANGYWCACNDEGYYFTSDAKDAIYHCDWNGTVIKSKTGISSAYRLIKVNNKYYGYWGGSYSVYDSNLTFLHNFSGFSLTDAWYTVGDNKLYSGSTVIKTCDTSTDIVATWTPPTNCIMFSIIQNLI